MQTAVNMHRCKWPWGRRVLSALVSKSKQSTKVMETARKSQRGQVALGQVGTVCSLAVDELYIVVLVLLGGAVKTVFENVLDHLAAVLNNVSKTTR